MAESALCLIVLICVIEFGARQASLICSLLCIEQLQSVVPVVVYSALYMCVNRFPFLFGDDDLGAAKTGVYTLTGCVYVYVGG